MTHDHPCGLIDVVQWDQPGVEGKGHVGTAEKLWKRASGLVSGHDAVKRAFERLKIEGPSD